MDEYISREAVVRYLKGYSEKELNKGGNFSMMTSSVLDKAERAISEMPSADVQPMKHGRWERRAKDIYACTECTNEVSYRQSRNYSFCPYCGARMGGASDDEP